MSELALVGKLCMPEQILPSVDDGARLEIMNIPFYLKMGYHYKNGISEPDEEHLIRMEKYK